MFLKFEHFQLPFCLQGRVSDDQNRRLGIWRKCSIPGCLHIQGIDSGLSQGVIHYTWQFRDFICFVWDASRGWCRLVWVWYTSWRWRLSGSLSRWGAKESVNPWHTHTHTLPSTGLTPTARWAEGTFVPDQAVSLSGADNMLLHVHLHACVCLCL